MATSISVDAINIDRTQEMLEKRIKTSSKRVYKTSQNTALKWIKLKHPDFYNNEKDALKLPLPEAVVVEYMGSNLVKKDGQFKSVAAVGTQWSALKNLYRDNNQDLEAYVDVKDVISGHSRVIAEQKESGQIKQQEGTE